MWSSVPVAFKLIFSGDTLLGEIVGTTMRMALTSSVLALLIGVPIGLLIGIFQFPGKKAVTTLLRTFMALPPVVVGIVVYIFLSGSQWIYTVEAMILAQIILLIPITAGMMESYVSAFAPAMLETAKGLQFGFIKTGALALNESKYQFIVIYLMAFSRAIAEVGAIQIVGGNILHKTRTMTTAIALNYNTGQFKYAIALGIILLLISLFVNILASVLQNVFDKK